MFCALTIFMRSAIVFGEGSASGEMPETSSPRAASRFWESYPARSQAGESFRERGN